MDLQEPKRYVYPNDPHVMTNADVQDVQMPTFPPGPGLAPVLSFPLQSTHFIVSHWRDLCRAIVLKLRGRSMNWVSVECVRRRQHPTRGDARSDDATILITVEKLAEINHDLREFLDEVHELSGLYVEISEGGIWQNPDRAENVHVGPNCMAPYPIQFPMGGSVEAATVPGRWLSTLGGYVEIFKGEEVKPCALTCNHLIAPEPDGYRDRRKTRVLYPSRAEISVIVAGIEEDAEYICSRMEGLEGELAIGEDLNGVKQGTHDSLNSVLASYQNQMRETRSADRDIGAIFARSGVDILTENQSSPIRIDWALIELNPERIGTNNYTTSAGLKRTVQTVGLPCAGCPVSKTGAMTGLTNGVINGVQSCLNWGVEDKESMEWAILPDTPLPPTRPQQPFGIPGDSGSFIMVRSNSVLLGMLWGGTLSCDRAYFTPIQDIAKDILTRTGFHTRLPNNGQHICC